MQRPEHDRGRPGREAAPDVNYGDTYTLPQRIDQTVHDVLLEALLAGERAWWMKRAEEFERAKPDPARDFTGRATDTELRAQWRRLDGIARACRARAQVSPVEHIREDVANVLNEMSVSSTSRSEQMLEDRLTGLPDRLDVHHQYIQRVMA